MNEIEYERDQELAAQGQHCNACMKEVLTAYRVESLPELYRSIYKFTPCGPWLSVRTWDGRTFHCDQLHEVNKDDVRYLRVGSIVEGSDAEVTADWIDLLECESPEDAFERLYRSVWWVNDEACALWEEANGED